MVKESAKKAVRKQSRFTRNVLHGNAMNKRGVAADHHHCAEISRKIRSPKSKNQLLHSMKTEYLLHEFSDGVVTGAWTRDEKPPITIHPNELKFTIPNFPNNNNVFEQNMMRTTALKSQMLNEFRTRSLSRSHSDSDVGLQEDYTHEIELLD
jgi:hypothetical protein